MSKLRISPALLIGSLIVIFFVVSLVFRICNPYGLIFVGDEIKYANNDSYFYMSLVDNTANHFPQLTEYHPYFIYPGGGYIASMPFFHWIIVFLAWVIGLGHPTQHLIDMIAVYLPAVMAALTIIPVFFIGKALFNKWVGVLAAGLVAIFPGEYLARSVLGATDNPVAETFFTTVALAFLIYAIKTASQNGLTFDHIIKRNWKIIIKPLLLSLFAGVFLGLYLITWAGALIFIAIIAIYLIIQFIVNHYKQKSSDYLCIVGFVTFLFTFIILMFNRSSSDITIAMVVAMLIPLVLYGISRLISSRGLSSLYYPLTVIGLGAIAIVIVYFAAPDTFSALLDKFKFVILPEGATATTTTEMSSMLLPEANTYTTLVAWGNFTTSFFLAPWWLLAGLAAAAILGYLFKLNDSSGSGLPLTIFFVIAAAMLIAITAQQMPTNYNIGDDQVKFIPGIAFIGLAMLFYLFIRQDRKQPWHIATGWVLGIIILLSLMAVFTAYPNIRYLAIIPLVILIIVLFRQKDGDEHLRLFLIWCLIMFILPMIQRRFQYYLVINMALLSGYLSWEIIRISGLNRLVKKPEVAARKEPGLPEESKTRDYYELLGISKIASYKEIKSAFRKLTATYHPGPHNTPEAEERYKELNKAYQTLTDPNRRASYDGVKHDAWQKERRKSRRGRPGNVIHYVNVVLAVVLIFLFVYCPNISKAQAQSAIVPFAMSNEWMAALNWMRDNTPEPMGDPDAYYKYYAMTEENMKYPDTAYGVAAWWDFGYWITRVAHRIPNTNPSQWPEPIKKVATFFLSMDKATADRIREELGSAYIISDYDISVGKLPAVIQWAEQDREKYLPTYVMVQDNQVQQIQLFSLDYYRTLIVRLYNFGGKAVEGGTAIVVAYKMVPTSAGELKQLTDVQEFDTYQEAYDYIASQEPSSTTKYDVVGTDPFVSPIPLEAVEDYQLVYSSDNTSPLEEIVKIFQYIGD